MAITFQDHIENSVGAVATVNGVLSSYTNGDFGILITDWDGSPTTNTPTDTKGNTWVALVDAHGNSLSTISWHSAGAKAMAYMCKSYTGTSTANTVTCTISANATSFLQVRILSYRNVDKLTPIDFLLSAVGLAGTAAGTGAGGTTVYSKEMIVGMMENFGGGTMTASSPYNKRNTTTGNASMQDNYVTVATGIAGNTATWTGASDWFAISASLIEVGQVGSMDFRSPEPLVIQANPLSIVNY